MPWVDSMCECSCGIVQLSKRSAACLPSQRWLGLDLLVLVLVWLIVRPTTSSSTPAQQAMYINWNWAELERSRRAPQHTCRCAVRLYRMVDTEYCAVVLGWVGA